MVGWLWNGNNTQSVRDAATYLVGRNLPFGKTMGPETIKPSIHQKSGHDDKTSPLYSAWESGILQVTGVREYGKMGGKLDGSWRRQG